MRRNHRTEVTAAPSKTTMADSEDRKNWQHGDWLARAQELGVRGVNGRWKTATIKKWVEMYEATEQAA